MRGEVREAHDELGLRRSREAVDTKGSWRIGLGGWVLMAAAGAKEAARPTVWCGNVSGLLWCSMLRLTS